MYKTWRIVCTCLSALCVASAFLVALWFGLTGFLVCTVLALIFFVAMLYFKKLHELSEEINKTQAEKDEPTEENNQTENKEE